jgi:hypothetical protein
LLGMCHTSSPCSYLAMFSLFFQTYLIICFKKSTLRSPTAGRNVWLSFPAVS